MARSANTVRIYSMERRGLFAQFAFPLNSLSEGFRPRHLPNEVYLSVRFNQIGEQVETAFEHNYELIFPL